MLATVIAAACAGENLFTGPGIGGGGLLGPQVDITAPQPNITIPVGDSVNVTATLVSSEGITEVSFTGTLVAGGAAPFTPVVVPLTAVTDTTMSRYLKRSGTTAGAARIIVTAKDVSGDTGADTISVNLGS
jgi:hypothetical protein